MISQVRTATLSQLLLPKPRVSTYVALILGLGLVAALFEAISPTGFNLVSSLSWQSVLKDAAKNLGIVVSFSLGLAYIGHISKNLVVDTSIETQPVPYTGASRWAVLLGDVVRIIAFSFLITLFARISIQFGNNPVPITGQTLAVLLTGAVLGSRLGLLATVMYLCQGAAGMHVFAAGGFGLFWQLASGGYIIGFVAAAFLVGALAERGWDRGGRLLVAMLIGNVMLYIPGLIQLGFFVGWERTLSLGLYPFIPGDLAKLYVASLMVPAAWAVLRYRQREPIAWT